MLARDPRFKIDYPAKSPCSEVKTIIEVYDNDSLLALGIFCEASLLSCAMTMTQNPLAAAPWMFVVAIVWWNQNSSSLCYSIFAVVVA
jgi:hypothetical protein